MIESLNMKYTYFVILVSTYLPFAILGYKLGVYRFLDKAYLLTYIKYILTDLKNELANHKVNEYLIINYKGFTYNFLISDIEYCISMEHYLYIELNGNSYKLRYDLKTIKQKLIDKGFVEVYKGTLANSRYVQCISDVESKICLANNKKLHGSKRGIKKLKECLNISKKIRLPKYL